MARPLQACVSRHNEVISFLSFFSFFSLLQQNEVVVGSSCTVCTAGHSMDRLPACTTFWWRTLQVQRAGKPQLPANDGDLLFPYVGSVASQCGVPAADCSTLREQCASLTGSCNSTVSGNFCEAPPAPAVAPAHIARAVHSRAAVPAMPTCLAAPTVPDSRLLSAMLPVLSVFFFFYFHWVHPYLISAL